MWINFFFIHFIITNDYEIITNALHSRICPLTFWHDIRLYRCSNRSILQMMARMLIDWSISRFTGWTTIKETLSERRLNVTSVPVIIFMVLLDNFNYRYRKHLSIHLIAVCGEFISTEPLLGLAPLHGLVGVVAVAIMVPCEPRSGIGITKLFRYRLLFDIVCWIGANTFVWEIVKGLGVVTWMAALCGLGPGGILLSMGL